MRGLVGGERLIDVEGRLNEGGVKIQGGLLEGGGVLGLESRSMSGGVLVISGLMMADT